MGEKGDEVVKSKQKWRRFEELVAQIQCELAPNAIVTHDDKIKGQDSLELRQVDVTVKQKIGQYEMLIAIDCKDFTDPVDVNEVEKSIGLIKLMSQTSCKSRYGVRYLQEK